MECNGMEWNGMEWNGMEWNNVDIQYILTEMGLFDNKLYNFIMLLFVSGIIVQIMKFFDIEFVFYISYLLWFIAIGIFVIVLPRGQSSVI
jgi:hypothetical protein